MAISLENLIDLNLLTYYDENIKKYIANKIVNSEGATQFLKDSELPAEGKEDVLYVTEDGIKVWDPVAKQYADISSGGNAGESAGTWDSF